MSGICGIIQFNDAPVSERTLADMASAAAHRGTDGTGYWRGGGAGLAHLALRITPEEQHEVQPMVAPEGDLVVVSDARIDNRDELITLLQSKNRLPVAGPDGPPVTDAALILAAFQQWGTECAAHLLGDFAFAVWDTRRRQLHAARDAMGMRALYFRVERTRLLFATEIKQILNVPGVPPRLYEPAVAAHLAGRFDDLESTCYEGISQLPPAHALIAEASSHRTWRFWDIDPDRRIRYRDEREYAEHFREVFEEAVRCRLRSARAIGIFLSGGMDSCSIASTAGWVMRDRHVPCPSFRPYSWTFRELPEIDETAVSSGIVRHYGFDATEICADEWWPLRDYPDHGPDQDEPYVGIYQALIDRGLSAAQSDGVRVMMSGDRGDLMTGEYIYDYTGLFWSGQWSTLMKELQLQGEWRDASTWAMCRKFLLRPMRGAVWPQGRAERLRQPLQKLFRRINGAQSPYPAWIRSDFARRNGLEDVGSSRACRPVVDGLARKQRYSAIFVPMQMRGMVWTERSHARYGQAFWDPWSDRRLAEFVLAIPQRVLNRTGDEKRLVRMAMRDVMPEKVRQAVQKVPMGPLYRRALTEKAVGTITDLLTDSQIAARGYVQPALLRDHYESVRRGEAEDPGLWLALSTEMWLRRYWS